MKPIYFAFFLLPSCTVFAPLEDDPVRHLLEPSVSARTPVKAVPAVAIARPSLPPYLERNELILRNEGGSVKVLEYDLWSEPLDSGIARVMAENLRRLTGSTNIQQATHFITRDYTHLVEIRIDRFDPEPEGQLLFECTWKLQPVKGGDSAPKAFRTKVPFDPAKGTSARIAAMNEALGGLARAIARELPP